MAPRPDPEPVLEVPSVDLPLLNSGAQSPHSVVTVSHLEQATATTGTSCGGSSLLQPLKPAFSHVVLVDPLSTGVLLQQRLLAQGYHIILVWSDRSQPASRDAHVAKSGGERTFAAIITHEAEALDATIEQILAVTSDIGAVMCGSEHGVLLEDQIANRLNAQLPNKNLAAGVRSSGMHSLATKVDKHAQASTIAAAGLESVRETLAKSEEDVKKFLETTSAPYVVKPQTGAGSVGVTFCATAEAVWEAYHKILAGEHKAHCRKKYKHYEQAGVLLQEYLQGTEYIVNAVINRGQVKTTACFKYDKRPYNGAAFVCFSKELLVLGDEPRLQDIVTYTEKVLAAVGFQNGAVHAEIMYIEGRGPVLVELNCRLHGGNGAWVHPASLCMGYDQLSVFLDVYLHGNNDINNEHNNNSNGQHPTAELWKSVPPRPLHKLASCQQVKMRSHVTGILRQVIPEQWARIQALPSYLEHTFGVQVGDMVLKTIDMPSVPGEVTLVHQDAQQLAKDYELLNEILREGIFDVEDEPQEC